MIKELPFTAHWLTRPRICESWLIPHWNWLYKGMHKHVSLYCYDHWVTYPRHLGVILLCAGKAVTGVLWPRKPHAMEQTRHVASCYDDKDPWTKSTAIHISFESTQPILPSKETATGLHFVSMQAHQRSRPTRTLSFFSFWRNNNLRSHPFLLLKHRINTMIRQHSFALWVVKSWNSLSADLITVPSNDVFKALEFHHHTPRLISAKTLWNTNSGKSKYLHTVDLLGRLLRPLKILKRLKM